MIQQIIKNPENVDNADKFEGQIVSNTRKNYVRQMSEDLNSGKQTLIKRELKRRRWNFVIIYFFKNVISRLPLVVLLLVIYFFKEGNIKYGLIGLEKYFILSLSGLLLFSFLKPFTESRSKKMQEKIKKEREKEEEFAHNTNIEKKELSFNIGCFEILAFFLPLFYLLNFINFSTAVNFIFYIELILFVFAFIVTVSIHANYKKVMRR